MVARERKRLIALLGLVLGTALVPGLVLTVFGLSDGATVAVFGALTGLVATLAAGPRPAIVMVGSLGLVSAIIVPVEGDPWICALVLASASAAVGMTAQRGLSGGLMLAPIALAFTVSEPPMSQFDAPWRSLLILAVTWAAGLFAILIAHLLIHFSLPAAEHVGRSRAVVYAGTLFLLVGIATWFVVDHGLGHAGGWAIMTILIVVQPFIQDAWHMSIQRAGGTLLGFLIALAFTVVAGFPVIMYIAGGVFVFIALVMRLEKRPYWLYATLLTPAVVLLEGTSGALEQTAWQRLLATLVGAGAAVTVILILRPMYSRAAVKYDLDHW